MIARVRDFCRDESLGIVLPGAFVILLALWSLLTAVGRGVFIPILDEIIGGSGSFPRLETRIGDITLDWAFVVADAAALVLLGALVYYVFVRPIPEDAEPETGMRECPECLSAVLVEARRCVFCTSPLPSIQTGPS